MTIFINATETFGRNFFDNFETWDSMKQTRLCGETHKRYLYIGKSESVRENPDLFLRSAWNNSSIWRGENALPELKYAAKKQTCQDQFLSEIEAITPSVELEKCSVIHPLIWCWLAGETTSC